MASHKCPHCAAYNSDEGRCIVCGKQMGNLRKAVQAAFATAVLLGLLWIAFTWITGKELPILAVFFGAIISWSTTHFSAGRGILYQLIATVATIVGIVGANSIAILITFSDQGLIQLSQMSISQFLELMEHHFKYDPITPICYLLGIAGGLWIWK